VSDEAVVVVVENVVETVVVVEGVGPEYVQQELQPYLTTAAANGTYVAASDEAGDPIPGKHARVIFDSSGFPVDIVLEDAS
jgi:hypothetical protein